MLGGGHGCHAGRERLFAASLVALALALGPTVSSALAAAPHADFSATPNPVVIHNSVFFDAKSDVTTNLRGGPAHRKLGSTDDGTIVSYQWDLDDDGQFDDATGSTASQQFDALGAHDVHLRVTDNEGLSDVATVTVNVTTAPPSARLSFAPTAPSSLDPVTFDASASTDPDDGIDHYDWDFEGDGTFDATTTTPTTTHAYATPGARHAVVRVTDDSGATGYASLPVNVANLLPSADLIAPSLASAGEAVALDASGSGDLDGTILHYRWDFDGNGIFDADTPSATIAHVFPGNGTYTVKLRVIDDFGGAGEITHVIAVTGAPIASFAIVTDPAVAGSPVGFDASASYDTGGSVVRYDWDLDGNGSFETTTGSSPTVSRTYANPGTVVVRVRVVDDQGGQGTAAQTLVVKAAPAPPPSGGLGDIRRIGDVRRGHLGIAPRRRGGR